MVKDTSYMFITGPDVIKTVTHEDVTKEELGGALTHNRVSGVAHFAADSDEHALRLVRELLSFIPSNNLDDPPRIASTDSPERMEVALNSLVPEASNQPYDIRDAFCRWSMTVTSLKSTSTTPEHRRRLRATLRARGRDRRQSTGYLAGVLDIRDARKGARFVRFCDCFNIAHHFRGRAGLSARSRA